MSERAREGETARRREIEKERKREGGILCVYERGEKKETRTSGIKRDRALNLRTVF